jgi:hypothetical protein
MWIKDESLLEAMNTAEAEALRLHAAACGSEHVLLGLLSARDPLTEQVLAEHPELTVEAVRHAIVEAVDDAPTCSVSVSMWRSCGRPSWRALPIGWSAGRTGLPPSSRLLSMTRASSVGSAQARAVPSAAAGQRTSLCWLTVLEPSCRAHRLLQALAVDPDLLRATVLRTMVAPALPHRPGPPMPAWLAGSLYSRFAERVYVAS